MKILGRLQFQCVGSNSQRISMKPCNVLVDVSAEQVQKEREKEITDDEAEEEEEEEKKKEVSN